MIDLGRRRLFGLLAAPAIISITGKLQPSLILPSGVSEMAFDVDQRILDMPTRGMDPSAFRRIVEPGLRAHFATAFEKAFEGYGEREIDEHREVQRELRRLQARRHGHGWQRPA